MADDEVLAWTAIKPEVEITADRIERVTADYIRADLGAEQVELRPPARGG